MKTRRIALAVIVVLCVAFLGHAVGRADSDTPKVVRAERFVVCGQDGEELAKFGTMDDGQVVLDLGDSSILLKYNPELKVSSIMLHPGRDNQVLIAVTGDGTLITAKSGDRSATLACSPGRHGSSSMNLESGTGSAFDLRLSGEELEDVCFRVKKGDGEWKDLID